MIKIVAVGNVKEKENQALIKEYQKRISRYDKVEILEVKEEPLPTKSSDALNEKVKEEEGKRILSKIKDDEFVVLLDLKGEMVDSIKLSEKMESWKTYQASTLTWIIGGSIGVSEEVKKRANWMWKLSDLTFPHQIVRLLLLEQIYRAFKIQRNETYHK